MRPSSVSCLLALLLCSACVRSGTGVTVDATAPDATSPDATAPDATAPDATSPGHDADVGLDAPRFAIYDDTAESDASAWAEGLDLIEAALAVAGSPTERIDRTALNSDPHALDGFDGIVFGGGFAYPGYTVGISDTGKQRLRAFVEGGGLYVGVCAGAYFACDEVHYEGETFADESGYNLDLYPAACDGPVGEVAHYPDWALAQIGFEAHPSHAEFGDSFTASVWYAGGPYFSDVADEVEVLARYADPGIEQEGAPAVIAQPVGEGAVLLWGPHFEVTAGGASETNPALFAEVVRWFAH